MTSSAVGAPDLSGLIELSRDPQLDLKPVILRVQSDLFLAASIHDRAMLESFEALATGLIPTVDDETADLVAQKLAPFPETPHGVLVALAARGGVCAETVIALTPHLSPVIVATGRMSGADADAAIKLRGERLKERAAETEAAERALAFDPAAFLDRDLLERLIRKGRADAELAKALLARTDLAPSDLVGLWLHADAEQRRTIRDAIEATSALRPSPPASREIGPVLTDLSTQGDVRGFAAALAGELGVPSTFLTCAPDPTSRYDLLTLALRAIDMREQEAIHVFLTLNDVVACSVERVFGLVKLFRETSRPAARDLVAGILDVTLPERAGKGEHQPYYAENAVETRASAGAERPAARPALPARLSRRA